MADISVDDLRTRAENTLYTAVGLGILGFQHLQVQRRQLERQVTATARQLVEQVERATRR